jgi:hypothetical protein
MSASLDFLVSALPFLFMNFSLSMATAVAPTSVIQMMER